jgi:hypothetical protein
VDGVTQVCGPQLVVVEPPVFDEQLGIVQTREPVSIETLVPTAAVKALDEGVLDRLAGIDELQLDAVMVGLMVHEMTG